VAPPVDEASIGAPSQGIMPWHLLRRDPQLDRAGLERVAGLGEAVAQLLDRLHLPARAQRR